MMVHDGYSTTSRICIIMIRSQLILNSRFSDQSAKLGGAGTRHPVSALDISCLLVFLETYFSVVFSCKMSIGKLAGCLSNKQGAPDDREALLHMLTNFIPKHGSKKSPKHRVDL